MQDGHPGKTDRGDVEELRSVLSLLRENVSQSARESPQRKIYTFRSLDLQLCQRRHVLPET